MQRSAALCTLALVTALASPAVAGDSFTNWESPHVSPLDLTPDGSLLLAVNTADNRLEVFSVAGGGLTAVGAVPVGLDPVSVRARTNTEAWVVNHVSDSISVVNLVTMNVSATLHTGDEPTDLVFAGNPELAFVSVSQLNQVKVFNPASPAAPPITIDIEGEDPRALATDGSAVYVAIFESGNKTTAISEFAASFGPWNPYPGNPNPPPNNGNAFDPPIAPGLPAPPEASMILKKDSGGAWRDDNGMNWSAAVSWDLHDHDIAIIDAGTLGVSYATGTMNLNMALAFQPGVGATVVGTEATNEVRFEPNLRGTFVRVHGAVVTGAGAAGSIVDLNPHLDYSTGQVPQVTRDQSIGDPRGIAWNAAGDVAYVTGMGSNNVVVLDASLGRTGRIEVGEGPTGVRIDEANDRVYVLNKFEGTVSIIDSVAGSELSRAGFYDPTPDVIVEGRPFLYDTHMTSGLGQASCASCHIDGRMDQVSWDLGDPTGEMKTFNQDCNDAFNSDCEDWHPMKGPMATQTLVGIVGGTEPFHWRGDREDLAAFSPTFVGLQGDDAEPSASDMQMFTDFIATLAPPPNPFRGLDNSLPTSFPNGGNAVTGRNLFNNGQLDAPFECASCHPQPFGTDNRITSNELDLQTQSVNTPHLMNMYEKTGFSDSSQNNNRGFGYVHDGSFDTLFNFLGFGFDFTNDQQRLDVEAYLMSFSRITHAGVGAQATVPATGGGAPATAQELVDLAVAEGLGLVAKGLVGGEARGYYLLDATTLQSDRLTETTSVAALIAAGAPGAEVTFTLVPDGAAVRIGVDRDEDGFFDRDELDAGSDPGDPDSTPGIGTSYCMNAPNSTGSVASIQGFGSSSVAANDLLLTAAIVPDQFGVFFYGPSQVQNLFGNGFLCVGGQVNRLPVELGVNGTLSHALDNTAPPVASGQITSGSTWNFQAWYRDPNGGGAFFNLSDGLEVLFTP